MNNNALFGRLHLDGYSSLVDAEQVSWAVDDAFAEVTDYYDVNDDWSEAHAAFQEDVYDPDWQE